MMMPQVSLANPGRFLEISQRLLPWLGGGSAVALAIAVYMAFVIAPADYQQGETVRIMFIHVPAAWLAMLGWALMALSGLGTLVWRHPLADVAARAMAPIGAGFALVCLVSGALWGRPMWGAFWVWDGRLTSFLILFFMYLGVIALWSVIEEPGRAGRAVAILTLAGALNLPIIKFSVDWWATLHQPSSVLRVDGPTLHPAILMPLLVCAGAFFLIFVTLHLMAMRNDILRRRLFSLRMLAAASQS